MVEHLLKLLRKLCRRMKNMKEVLPYREGRSKVKVFNSREHITHNQQAYSRQHFSKRRTIGVSRFNVVRASV
ncbi:hypothetical protein SESBI_15125 [Sesbania bispinosa]|nr:hypothetical protein SESBI_15125 [Sesbania bispinosa]